MTDGFVRITVFPCWPLLTLERAAMIMINVCEYGVPYTGLWLQRVVQLLYWIYIATSFTSSAAMYLTLWSTQ